MPAIIDSGPSQRGWSYYQPYFRCLKYGAILHSGLIDDESDALIRGTLGHVGLGHLHIRWMLQQRRQDPNAYYPPLEAMEAWTQQHPQGRPFLAQMQEVVRRYMIRFDTPPGRAIIGVEMGFTGVVGTVDGKFDLYLLHPNQPFDASWRATQPLPYTWGGRQVEPATLTTPGTRFGEPIYITRKLDLVYEEGRGLACVRDFKCTQGDTSGARALTYAMDGQFAVTRLFGWQAWGERFGANTIQLVGVDSPWPVKSHPLPATPWRDVLFARFLYQKAHEIAYHEIHTPLHEWPMAQHEQVCRPRYEKEGCPAMGFCMHGPHHRQM